MSIWIPVKIIFQLQKTAWKKTKNQSQNGPISKKSKKSTFSRNLYRGLQPLNINRSKCLIHHFLAENVFLDPCKKNHLTPENSVEKDEKPIPKWADF